MDERRVLEEVKRIKRRTIVVKTMAIILVIAVMLLPVKSIFKLFLILVIVVIAVMLVSKIKGSFLHILYDECDAKTFYGVCRGVYPQGEAVLYEALTGFFIGDFEGSVRLASSALTAKQIAMSRFEFTSLIADNAFVAGDFEMCRHFSNQALELLGRIKVKEELKRGYTSKFNYFISFMNGDYAAAISAFNFKGDDAKNSSKLMSLYYLALACYYNGDTEKSAKLFEEIVNKPPKFFITKKAEQYLSAIKNNEFVEIKSGSLSNAYEQGRVPVKPVPVTKSKRVRSILVMVILIVVAVMSITQLPGMASGSAYDVIANEEPINEVCKMLPLDEEYTLCIYNTEYDEIGVAYLKNKGDNKYSYCISYVGSPEMYTEEDDGYYMYASGETPKVYFDITDNKELIPDGSQITEFESNGNTYYFYITKTEVKNHFANACGMVVN